MGELKPSVSVIPDCGNNHVRYCVAEEAGRVYLHMWGFRNISRINFVGSSGFQA